MIVLNTCFIRRSNGLFHYGLDYAEALAEQIREVWVRDGALAEVAAARLPSVPVRVLRPLSMIREMRLAGKRRDLVFTPSSHPLALGARTVVVVHDSFPFQGTAGVLKKAIFRAGMLNQSVTAAYVNRSDALAFLDGLGLPAHRTRYLPNRLAAQDLERPAPVKVGEVLRIGLFGSDSEKKNYAALFASLGKTSLQARSRWLIYGHVNEYTQRLTAAFPGISMEVVSSDEHHLQGFIDSLDLTVSVAENEGFARPIALSLDRGVPAFLLENSVFREFYSGSARFFPDVDALVEELASLAPGQLLPRPHLISAPDLRRAFAEGVAWLATR